MTIDLALELTERPSAIEQRLTAAVHRVAHALVERPEVMAGLVAADSILPGLVIVSEVDAIQLADAARLVIEAEKALAHGLGKVLDIPSKMEAAARGAVALPRAKLVAAKRRANDARVAWQGEQRRLAAKAEAEARERARQAAEAAAAEAILTGEDPLPEPEVASIVVPRSVVGGIGSTGTQVRIEAKEIVNDAECPVEWKVVVRAIAEGFFRTAEQAGQVKRAAPGESVVWKGVRFESVERAVNR